MVTWMEEDEQNHGGKDWQSVKNVGTRSLLAFPPLFCKTGGTHGHSCSSK